MNTVTNTPRKTLNKLSPKLVRLHPSRILLTAVIVVYIVAIAAVVVARLPFLLQQLLVVVLFMFMGYYFHQWRTMPTYRLQHNQCWKLIDNQSDAHSKSELTIEHCYYWSKWVIILRVTDKSGSYHHFPIFCDSCIVDEFHYIRILSKTAF